MTKQAPVTKAGTRYSVEIYVTDVSGRRLYRRIEDADDVADPMIGALIAESDFVRIDERERPLPARPWPRRVGRLLAALRVARDTLGRWARLVIGPMRTRRAATPVRRHQALPSSCDSPSSEHPKARRRTQ